MDGGEGRAGWLSFVNDRVSRTPARGVVLRPVFEDRVNGRDAGVPAEGSVGLTTRNREPEPACSSHGLLAGRVPDQPGATGGRGSRLFPRYRVLSQVRHVEVVMGIGPRPGDGQDAVEGGQRRSGG